MLLASACLTHGASRNRANPMMPAVRGVPRHQAEAEVLARLVISTDSGPFAPLVARKPRRGPFFSLKSKAFSLGIVFAFLQALDVRMMRTHVAGGAAAGGRRFLDGEAVADLAGDATSGAAVRINVAHP